VRINRRLLVEEAELAHMQQGTAPTTSAATNLRVLLDFKNVRRMSSSAAMMIAELSRWLRPNGSTLAVCRLRPELKQMMQTLHVGDTNSHVHRQANRPDGTW